MTLNANSDHLEPLDVIHLQLVEQWFTPFFFMSSYVHPELVMRSPILHPDKSFSVVRSESSDHHSKEFHLREFMELPDKDNPKEYPQQQQLHKKVNKCLSE